MTSPHAPWATHAMRGFESQLAARENALKNAPGSSFGTKKIDGTWEWYYPQYEIEMDILDTLPDNLGVQFKKAKAIIEELREALNDALYKIKVLT